MSTTVDLNNALKKCICFIMDKSIIQHKFLKNDIAIKNVQIKMIDSVSTAIITFEHKTSKSYLKQFNELLHIITKNNIRYTIEITKNSINIKLNIKYKDNPQMSFCEYLTFDDWIKPLQIELEKYHNLIYKLFINDEEPNIYLYYYHIKNDSKINTYFAQTKNHINSKLINKYSKIDSNLLQNNCTLTEAIINAKYRTKNSVCSNNWKTISIDELKKLLI